MVGKDLIMATLFGSGGGSSGSGGGGSAGVSPKEVNFYDYDGTCVHAYTVAEAQALSELPAGPEHPGLVFQGWNWSLEGVKGLTRAMNIGAMYTTDDGTTRLYITLQEGRTSPMLGVGVNGTVTVDWGDGTEPDVLTGTNVSATVWTPNHTYDKPGDYVIRLTVEGEIGFTGSSTSNANASVLRYASGADKRNQCYQSTLKKIEMGNGVVHIGSYSFTNCYSLAVMAIPESVTSIYSYAFNNCYSLLFVTIPKNVTNIGNNTFYMCYSLLQVALPINMQKLSDCSFQYCYALAVMTIPPGAVIGASTFYGCYGLSQVVLPGRVESYGISAFANCYSLASVNIPPELSKIVGNLFYNCHGAAYYDFTQHTTVPTLADTSAFKSIPADCEIRVPAALYDEWIAETNWATYADYIKAY